jgi:two-component system response regulator
MSYTDTILLVEDNDDDAELTIMAFQEAKIANPIIRVADGVEALDYLFARGRYSDRRQDELPTVVLLDLKLPRMGGIEVLKQVRASPLTRFQPVVILTSSAEEQDRVAAYDNHANSYVRKPVDYDQFVAATRQLGLYWSVLNLPPPGPATRAG